MYDLFTQLGYKVGLLSTVEIRIAGQIMPATHTTPDALSIQSKMADMVEAGCDYAFMEVSSHAIDQNRISGLHFAGAVFTNISHDHLDYHKTFKAYINAKKQLFDQLPSTAFALVNLDDKRGQVMVQNTSAKVSGFALKKKTDYKAKILENTLSGLHLLLDNEDFYGRLIGNFNAYNLLAVYAVAIELGMDKMEVLTALSGLKPAPGRFETIESQQLGVIGIVDYAHTPDALEKVLQTIDQLREGKGRIISVVGCGGDRDRAKRPLMAKVACDYSQLVLLTSDNPRSEDPEAILQEMQAGVPGYASERVLTITNRKEAIRTAGMLSQRGDILLVAGKGHEKYQEINGVKHPFDDAAELRDIFKNRETKTN